MMTPMLISSHAMAQGMDDNDGNAIEEIIVVGVYASTERNLSLKRTSNSVVDVITAEDVGKFPDKNVADSLQRVPGITISRSGGEGSRVSIRGTSSDWTLTQLNGNYLATSDSGGPVRSFNYTLLPANMIGKAEVFKSPEARLDEGGIGGTVILHTRKPLDMESGSGVVSAETTYSDTTGKWEPQFNFMYSWKNEQETFGILVGFTKQDRTVRGIQNNTSHWRFHSDTVEGAERPAIVDQATGEVFNNVWAPRAMSVSSQNQDRKRTGYQATLQWQPTSSLELGFNYLGAKLGYGGETQSVTFAEWNDNHNPYFGMVLDGDTVVAYGFGDNGLLNDANWGDADVNGGVPIHRGLMSPQLTGVEIDGTSKSNTYDFDMIYRGDTFTASANFGRTEAGGGTANETGANIDARKGSVNNWHWSIENGKPEYDISTDLATDRNAYQYYDWFWSRSSENKDKEDYVQADIDIDTDWGVITTIRTGAKYRNHKIEGFRNDHRWDDGIPDNGGYRGWLSGTEWFHNPDFHPEAETLLGTDIIDNSVGNTGAFNYLPFSFAKLNTFLGDQFTLAVVPVLSGTYSLSEKILSSYAQADFEWEKLRGNFGVRYVKTNLSTLTYDDIRGQENGDSIPNTRDSNSSEFLPSLNVAWDMNDDLVFRLAAARTMSRINYSDLSQAESYGPPVNINSPDSWTGRGSGTSANTGLEALMANQFDIGLEWYYAKGSAVGMALFKKYIKNIPIEATEIVERIHDCCNGPIEVEMRTKVGGGTATSEGIELFLQHSLENGLGLLTNYTYTNTSTTEVANNGEITNAEIPGTAKHQYNVSVYFERDFYSIRASYNWKSDRAAGIHQGYNYYDKAYGQLDVNASYNITDALTLTASAVNLTKAVSQGYWKQENRMTYYNYHGRRFYVGASYKF